MLEILIVTIEFRTTRSSSTIKREIPSYSVSTARYPKTLPFAVDIELIVYVSMHSAPKDAYLLYRG